MQDFRRLAVWQRSHAITLAIYRMTDHFPPEERFGLSNQLRRAAASVPTNIAEGSKRRRPGDYARFLNIALASLAEVEYLVMLSRDLGYCRSQVDEALLCEISQVGRMLNALQSKVEKSI